MSHGLRPCSCRRPAELIPDSVDLRPRMPPVYDQGETSSCTAQVGAALMQSLDARFEPSRLFLYLLELHEQGLAGRDEIGRASCRERV
jgi:hypothetical protein